MKEEENEKLIKDKLLLVQWQFKIMMRDDSIY